MKDAISVNVRWLSVFVGMFGFWCLLRAAVCVYLFMQFDVSAKGLKHLSPDTISAVKSTHFWLIVSIVAFAFVAMVSGVSAYGIFKDRNWARKIWVISSIALFIYFSLASWVDLSSLHAYIPGFILCIFSWYILWYVPRKNRKVDSCDAISGVHE